MERAAFLDEFEAIDAGDLTAGEKLTNHAERAVIVFVLPECWHQHAAIHDEEIHIGCRQDRQSPAGDFTGFRQRDFDDIK